MLCIVSCFIYLIYVISVIVCNASLIYIMNSLKSINQNIWVTYKDEEPCHSIFINLICVLVHIISLLKCLNIMKVNMNSVRKYIIYEN